MLWWRGSLTTLFYLSLSLSRRRLELLGPKTRKHETLENFHLLATRQKANIDRAMASFLSMLEADKDHLPALLGVSTAFMFEKVRAMSGLREGRSEDALLILRRDERTKPARCCSLLGRFSS